VNQIITKNFHALMYAYHSSQYNGIVLEGGSRSRKTWSVIEFLIWYSQQKSGVINILKETFSSFRTTLNNDFKKQFQEYGLNTPFDYAQEIRTFNLLRSKVNQIGADKISKQLGATSSVFWINEGLEITQEYFDQFEQRCQEFFIIDYNPYYTQHWIFEKVITREDVYFVQSTLFDNPYVPANEKRKILSYEPTHPDDRKLPKEKRRPHPKNIKNGTADDFMWEVYGLGIRAAQKGIIFQSVTWIDEFPDVGHWYGLDFGFTNDPSALVKVAIQGKNLYLELLIYEPTETSLTLDMLMKDKEVEKWKPITADSSDKYTGENKGTVEMVRDLKKKGWKISKVRKTKSIVYWIGRMKEYKIHVVKNKHATIEQESYKWKEVNGIRINQPIDKFDHFWSAARYGFMSSFKNKSPIS